LQIEKSLVRLFVMDTAGQITAAPTDTISWQRIDRSEASMSSNRKSCPILRFLLRYCRSNPVILLEVMRLWTDPNSRSSAGGDLKTRQQNSILKTVTDFAGFLSFLGIATGMLSLICPRYFRNKHFIKINLLPYRQNILVYIKYFYVNSTRQHGDRS